MGSHLAYAAALPQREGVLTDDDVTVIIEALFDIRTELRTIVALLEADDGTEGRDEEDS